MPRRQNNKSEEVEKKEKVAKTPTPLNGTERRDRITKRGKETVEVLSSNMKKVRCSKTMVGKTPEVGRERSRGKQGCAPNRP